MQVSAAVLPYLAPFSSTLFEYSFSYRYQTAIAHLPPAFSSEQAVQNFQTIWNAYLKEFQRARQEIFHLLDPYVELDQAQNRRQRIVTPAWIREQLAQLAPLEGAVRRTAVSDDTLSRYAQNHILRKDGWGIYNPQSIASVLICRKLDPRKGNWLPTSIPVQEEWWYCWAQERPGAPAVPCPYPHIPINLPRNTLLYTHWAGASWNEAAWLKIGYLGAVTFAGLLWDVRQNSANLTLEDLELWEKGISKRMPPFHAQSFNVSEDGEKLNRIDMSLGLTIVLQALYRYRASGLLQAEISRIPGVPGGKGFATIHVVEGKTAECSVRDSKGQIHPITIEKLQQSDLKRPREWAFHPYAIGTDRLKKAPYEFVKAEAIGVLKRLAQPIFTPSV